MQAQQKDRYIEKLKSNSSTEIRELDGKLHAAEKMVLQEKKKEKLLQNLCCQLEETI